jgi:hypothetical protein
MDACIGGGPNEVGATAINGQRKAGSALTAAGRFSPLGLVGFGFAYRMDNNVVVLSISAGAFGQF